MKFPQSWPKHLNVQYCCQHNTSIKGPSSVSCTCLFLILYLSFPGFQVPSDQLSYPLKTSVHNCFKWTETYYNIYSAVRQSRSYKVQKCLSIWEQAEITPYITQWLQLQLCFQWGKYLELVVDFSKSSFPRPLAIVQTGMQDLEETTGELWFLSLEVYVFSRGAGTSL